MSAPAKDDLKARATRAIIAHAFFRVESALTIALMILLAFFLPRPLDWWRWWFWLVLGGVSELLIIYTSISDERTGEHVVGEMLRAEYDPKVIKTRPYREKVEQALEYREQIEKAIAVTAAGVLRDHLNESVSGIADWIGSIFAIAQRLDAYERDELLKRDMNQVPGAIQQLERALATEKDAAVRAQIDQTITAKKAQQANLLALQNRMEQAQFRLEETLTALGTVYSQFQLISAQKLSGGGAKSLSDNIRTQVQGLQDILTSMNEVYGQQP